MILTVTGAEAGLGQPACVSDTVYVPAALTTIDCVVSLSLHRLPDTAEDVSVTLLPWQNESGPLAVIVGAGGIGFTTTVTEADGALVQLPTVCVTVNVPLVVTVMLCVVAPVLHVLPVVALDVSVTLPP
jgi:hypothetical protein